MTTVKLFAGLGNQLFQYAYGEYLRDRGRKVRYVLVPSPGCITDVFDIPKDHIVSSSNPIRILAVKASAKYFYRSYCVGFYQDREYAGSLAGSLPFKRETEYRRLGVFDRIGRAESVAVHVRGGDYLSAELFAEFGSVCGRRYYERAFGEATARLDNPRYFVFTNDRAHAEAMLPEDMRRTAEFVNDDPADPGLHLFLMSECRHAIIANSTFSWWGAFMKGQTEKKVIAPRGWGEKIYLPGWIRV